MPESLKLSIVSRYLIREIGLAWLAVTAVLVVVLFVNRLVRYLGEAAAGNLPGDMVLVLMGYKALSYTALVLPGSFFLGVILALGRLNRDSEMAALGACGIGPRELYKALILLLIPLTLLVSWLAFDVQPWAAREGRVAEQTAREAVEVQAIRPGRFLQSSRGDGMIYIEGFSSDGEEMRDVFLSIDGEREQTLIRSERGRIEVDAESGDQILVLKDGYRYDGIPGQSDWRLTSFGRHGARISEGEPPDVSTRRDGMATRELIGASDPREHAELHWRLAMPVMALVLGFIAIPLSRGSPRDGRYGRLLLAVLIYAVYSNGLTVTQGWLEDGALPRQAGLWPAHLLAVGVGLAMLWHQAGGFRRRRRS
ncbi:LPS export ABC transporter permease LptF [Methylonatrum kenyense]|uniref:LPS export ABC transporter permease LptF n=1 Tax=Methylonatrum kenyense TaxID=455253 RepID=UPI0020BF143A|nr:LPS export ABC transporter permease LptF [Methylonatrum kenyense]MCK8516105.1 LPS export ABC transporter permease LptF [Methylonatrum kenyense]